MATARAAGTSDLIRILTMAFLRYPEQRDREQGLLNEFRRMFRPRVRDGEELPVVGIAANAAGAVVLLMSNEKSKLNEDDFEDFFGSPPVPIKTRHVGHFELCAIHVTAGDSISYGATFSDTGTLGCVASDVAQNEFYLSCNHVLAATNSGSLGDLIWSPGSRDCDGDGRAVAELHDFEPIQFEGGTVNYMDAAVARPIPGVNSYRTIPGAIGDIHGVDSDPEFNSSVRKYGNVSGVTHADLIFKEMSFKLPYPQGNAVFVHQYAVVDPVGRVFAEAGDSGALVVNTRNEAVGLLYCKASAGDVAVVSPIGPILDRFGLTL